MKTNIKIKYHKFLITFSFSLLFLGGLPALTQAATLSFSTIDSFVVGSTVVVDVNVSSLEQSMNASSGTISFPSDKLEVVSLSQDDSIFNLWVVEPSFSNTSGTVDFAGIVLNQGFTGSKGKVLSITFRVKEAGVIPLVFSAGSVLTNDGNGTDILSETNATNFFINKAEAKVSRALKLK